jgi:hypothetical protein
MPVDSGIEQTGISEFRDARFLDGFRLAHYGEMITRSSPMPHQRSVTNRIKGFFLVEQSHSPPRNLTAR